MRPGSSAADATIESAKGESWLLECLGNRFICMVAAAVEGDRLIKLKHEIAALQNSGLEVDLLLVDAPAEIAELREGDRAIKDILHLVQQRYDLQPGSVYLFRPDQHVCARWRALDVDKIEQAMQRAMGFALEAV